MNKGQPRKLDDWGTLRAWAWGASRALDYFESDKAVDAKMVGIEGLVALEVIQCVRPRPAAQCAPIIEIAHLTFFHQADDALSQSRAVVGLKAGGREHRVAPAAS